jgi:hypothetical protein
MSIDRRNSPGARDSSRTTGCGAAIFRYGWPRYRRSYEQLAGWIAGQAAVDFPTATRARVLMIKRRTPTPEEVRAGKRPREERQQAIVLKLDEMEARRR